MFSASFAFRKSRVFAFRKKSRAFVYCTFVASLREKEGDEKKLYYRAVADCARGRKKNTEW